MPDRVEIYTDLNDEYRWRRVAENNRIVSVSGEGFTEKAYAQESAAKYNSDVPDAGLEMPGYGSAIEDPDNPELGMVC